MTLEQQTIPSIPGGETADAERALWQSLKSANDAEAREALFNLHYGFARRIAKRHFMDRRSGDIELADLYQLASAGLLEAIDHFDPELGAPFRAYARRRIAGSVLDGLAKMSEVREQISFRNRTRTERANSLLTESVEAMEPSEALDALIEVAVGLALGFMLEGSGLYIDEGVAAVPRQGPRNAYESLAWKEALHRLSSTLDSLPPREQTVVRKHYLTGLNFEQIGALLGVTKGRVSQIHKTAIALLRKRLGKAGDFKLER